MRIGVVGVGRIGAAHAAVSARETMRSGKVGGLQRVHLITADAEPPPAYAVGLDDHAPLASPEPDVSCPAGPPFRELWSRFLPAYRAEINSFVDVAKGNRPSPCTVAEALESFYVAEAATRSRLEHRPIRVEEGRAA